MTTRIAFLPILVALVFFGGALRADFTEDWNDASDQNNDWKYWIDSADTSTRPGYLGENKDMKWLATGGVGDTGFVWSPGNELKRTWGRFWPAYMAPPHPVAPVNLQNQTLSISVNDRGTLVTATPLSLHFFIGEWNANGAGLSDDTYIFFQHKSTIAIGENKWMETSFAIGDDTQWKVILESDGNTTKPSDLYQSPQQWGFTLDETALPAGSQFAFDGLSVVPEPAALALWILAGFFGCGIWLRTIRRERK